MYVLILGYSPRKIAPYLSFYIELLRSNNISFDYMTRDYIDKTLDISIENNQIVYYYSQPNSILGKILNIVRWRKEVKKILRTVRIRRIVKKYPGTVLLSRSQMYSTIAAGALNCRVREGNVCFCSAISTGNFIKKKMLL